MKKKRWKKPNEKEMMKLLLLLQIVLTILEIVKTLVS